MQSLVSDVTIVKSISQEEYLR